MAMLEKKQAKEKSAPVVAKRRTAKQHGKYLADLSRKNPSELNTGELKDVAAYCLAMSDQNRVRNSEDHMEHYLRKTLEYLIEAVGR